MIPERFPVIVHFSTSGMTCTLPSAIGRHLELKKGVIFFSHDIPDIIPGAYWGISWFVYGLVHWYSIAIGICPTKSENAPAFLKRPLEFFLLSLGFVMGVSVYNAGRDRTLRISNKSPSSVNLVLERLSWLNIESEVKISRSIK